MLGHFIIAATTMTIGGVFSAVGHYVDTALTMFMRGLLGGLVCG